jgi:hypothetical protein
MAFFDVPGFILEVFHFPPVVSYSIPPLSHLVVPLPTVLSIYPIMSSSSSKSGSVKQLSENPQPHVFEFGGRSSFPQFVVPMTINIFTILTNLPFHFWYHLPLPGPQSSQSINLFWTLILIHPITSHFLIILTTPPICFHSDCSAPHRKWLFRAAFPSHSPSSILSSFLTCVYVILIFALNYGDIQNISGL